VGSHDALPADQRSVNVYLYMAYDPTVECSNSVNYSIDYFKYRISEKKFNESVKFNEALKNASIESLVKNDSKRSSHDETLNPPAAQYSEKYMNKIIPIYLRTLCHFLENYFTTNYYISTDELLKLLPIFLY